MSDIIITGGTRLGGPSRRRVRISAGTQVVLRVNVVEIRRETETGELLAELSSVTGDLSTKGDRHEGVLL
jgi:hypothetical protein